MKHRKFQLTYEIDSQSQYEDHCLGEAKRQLWQSQAVELEPPDEEEESDEDKIAVSRDISLKRKLFQSQAVNLSSVPPEDSSESDEDSKCEFNSVPVLNIEKPSMCASSRASSLLLPPRKLFDLEEEEFSDDFEKQDNGVKKTIDDSLDMYDGETQESVAVNRPDAIEFTAPTTDNNSPPGNKLVSFRYPPLSTASIELSKTGDIIEDYDSASTVSVEERTSPFKLKSNRGKDVRSEQTLDVLPRSNYQPNQSVKSNVHFKPRQHRGRVSFPSSTSYETQRTEIESSSKSCVLRPSDIEKESRSLSSPVTIRSRPKKRRRSPKPDLKSRIHPPSKRRSPIPQNEEVGSKKTKQTSLDKFFSNSSPPSQNMFLSQLLI